jgi:hypothetical protein
VGPRAGLDAAEKRKISFLAENRTPVFQPVARRYIDWAIILADNEIICGRS